MRDESDEAHEECDADTLSDAGSRLPVLFVWETAHPHLGPKTTLVHLSVSLFLHLHYVLIYNHIFSMSAD